MTLGGGNPCRAVRHLISISKPSGVIVSGYATGPTSSGLDSIVGITVNGSWCSSNRFPRMPGYTPQVSTTCSKWINPGIHEIQIWVTGSDGLVLAPGSGFTGGILII